MTNSPRSTATRRGTLDDFLSADDIGPVASLPDAEWNALRRATGWKLTRCFCTLRNLLVYRTRFTRDAMGFAWNGIYRSLFVSSIVKTSYRNEGHFRSGDRIKGTGDFFFGLFALPQSGPDAREIVRLVNLRHHVAGVVLPVGDDRIRVLNAYEAEYTYVATAFIESIRRGLAHCGVSPASRLGREIAAGVCTILYQIAGLTGLTRMPRDLAAHERFRDAFDRHLREHPPSARVHHMAQEIARRIIPATACLSETSVREHISRHLDPETREYLFPDGAVLPELEAQRKQYQRQKPNRKRLAKIRARSAARRTIWQRPDVAALHQAYRVAASDKTDDRLIGAILLHAIDSGNESSRPLERRSIDLAAGEPLIRQGYTSGEMYVVLSTTAPLVVLHTTEAAPEPRQVATVAAPTVLGEISMWRGVPAVATVLTREPNQLDVLVIDRHRFEALKQESGFRAATAAEVQRRLSLNVALVGTLLEDTATRTGDARLASINQLFRYLTGDSHVALDRVIDLPEQATPAECVESLRKQVDEVVASGGLEADLERYLGHVVATIG